MQMGGQPTYSGELTNMQREANQLPREVDQFTIEANDKSERSTRHHLLFFGGYQN